MVLFESTLWKKSVIYQIYPKSFYSSDGKKTGDLKGVTEKLDYLSFLGVDYIWLTPIYKSPQRDNGYDISDYYTIDKIYGDMDDFNQLIEEAKVRKIGIIMDMVVNHTSTDHQWFKESQKDRRNPYRDFYFWRDEPNNWRSKFGGSAWEYDVKSGQYYLHLFDKTQADLNWENDRVRQEIYELMRFWVNKGVSGFRLDVINLISKDPTFPDDPIGDGRRFYTDGPRIHEYLKEIYAEVFAENDLITVGEMSSTAIEHCVKYSNPDEQELRMTFNFHHLKADYPNGEKWVDGDLDFLALKKIISDWQVGISQGGGWNALFWCNHDQPRIVSRYGNDQKYWRESAKMLGTALHMLQGTPYIYQGEEIGMTNPKFETIEEYRDVETLNMYQILQKRGLSSKAVIEIIKKRSRDNSRTPMQWNSSRSAGFTSGIPWISVASNYRKVNVEQALKDQNSILYHYKRLIELRKRYDIITEGHFQLILEEDAHIFAYIRHLPDRKLLVINNFYSDKVAFEVPSNLNLDSFQSQILISNYTDSSEQFKKIELRPYESIVYYLKK